MSERERFAIPIGARAPKNKSTLNTLKCFVKFPLRQSISCEQSSQVHGEKDSLLHGLDYVLYVFYITKFVLSFLKTPFRARCSLF